MSFGCGETPDLSKRLGGGKDVSGQVPPHIRYPMGLPHGPAPLSAIGHMKPSLTPTLPSPDFSGENTLLRIDRFAETELWYHDGKVE